MNSPDRILQMAIELFGTIGYHATSMRVLARCSGITQSTIYGHFACKEALTQEIALRMRHEILSTFENLEKLPYKRRLEKYISQVCQSVRTKTEFWRLNYSLRSSSEVINIIERDVDIMQVTIQNKLTWLLSGKSKKPDQGEVLLFWAAVDGAVDAYLSMERYPLDSVLKTLIEKY